MMFFKKSKEDVNMKLVDLIVKSYFACLRSNNIILNYSEISELLRHSMCKLLGLSSNGYSCKIENYSDIVVNHLVNETKTFNISEMTNDYKKGLLEACVHCMEMSRKRLEL